MQNKSFSCRTCKSDSGLRAFSSNYRPPRGSEKTRAQSGPSILPRPEDVVNNEQEVCSSSFYFITCKRKPLHSFA